MAWEVAGYALAAAVLMVAAAAVALMYRLFQSLRRWDRQAASLARQLASAMAEYAAFAAEGREAARMCNRTLSGFSRLAEGARAIGDAAESVAMAAESVAVFWRERAADDVPDWAGIGRYFGTILRRKFTASEDDASGPSHPGTSADPN